MNIRLGWRMVGGALACVAIAAAAQNTSRTRRPLDFYFIDVEGGAATLTVTPAGESILMDCGWPRPDERDQKRIEKAVKDAGLTQIDHFIASHWHTDHYGGIDALARRVPIKHFWDHGIPEAFADDPKGFPAMIAAYRTASGGKSTRLNAGDSIPLRVAGMPLELKVVAANTRVIGEGAADGAQHCAQHPTAPVPDTSDNMQSLAVRLKYGKFDFLNCGDLTWNIEHKLACPSNRVGQIDLWQVTHHGAPQSGNPALVQAIQPVCAVICNGPKKGGAPATFATLKKSKSLEGIFQLHRNVTSGAGDNTDAAHIANSDENCKGSYVRARLNPAGTEYSVSFEGGETIKTFRVK